MRKFRVLPLVLAVSLAGQVQASDLMSIARDALVNNADLAASRSGYSSVQAGEDIERGDLLPQVSATGGVTRYNITSSQSRDIDGVGGVGGVGGGAQVDGAGGGGGEHYTGTTVQVQATQALFDATNWYQLEASKRQTAQEALNLRVDRQQLLYNVAEAYFEVLRAKEQLDTLRAEEQAVSRQLEQVRQQFDVGIVAATDVYEAQASYDLTHSQRISQESTLQVNFEALEQLTGKQYSSIDGLADDMPIERPTPASQQAWVEMASSQNLDLLAARAAVDVARANLDTSRAGHLPVLSAFANYQYGDSSQDNLRGHNEQNQIGLEATIPIYTGGSTSAQVRQSTFSLEQTQYQQESQLRTAVQQVRSYYARALNNVLSVQAQQRSIESNRSALEATRNGYEVGTRNIVDVLQAQQNLFTAISNYADARFDYVLNLLSLRQEAGILDVDSLDVLNGWLRADKAVLLNFQSQGTTGLGIGDDQPDPGMNGPSPLEGNQGRAGQRRLPPPNRTAMPDNNDLNGLGHDMPGDTGY